METVLDNFRTKAHYLLSSGMFCTVYILFATCQLMSTFPQSPGKRFWTNLGQNLELWPTPCAGGARLKQPHTEQAQLLK